MEIRAFRSTDENDVIALWESSGLIRPWNDPRRDIARKLTVQPELFVVGILDGVLIASAMIGYDGHRGWVYYLAVSAAHRQKAYGRALMQHAESVLIELGCPKVNLQVRTSNLKTLAFYEALGYAKDDAVSLGKRLISDQ